MASLSKQKPKVEASFAWFYYHCKVKKEGFDFLLPTEFGLRRIRKKKKTGMWTNILPFRVLLDIYRLFTKNGVKYIILE